MDNFEPRSPSAPPETGQLQSEVDSLRHLVVSLVILLFIISGTLNIYLLRQWRSSHTELNSLRAVVDDYNKVKLPQITNFVARLTEYGQTHTNFMPILEKYNLKQPAATSAPPAKAAVKK
jgi:hypothetical protein